MATLLQQKLASVIVDDLRKGTRRTKKDLLVTAGYSLSRAEATPEHTIAQKGVQEALMAEGIDIGETDGVVRDIMLDGSIAPSDRLRAADLSYKRSGAYAPEKSLVIEVDASYLVDTPQSQEVKDFENRLLASFDDDKDDGSQTTIPA